MNDHVTSMRTNPVRERLRAGGHLYEQDGAVWFRSTDFGDDKDRVIYRSNGEPTYFAAGFGVAAVAARLPLG